MNNYFFVDIHCHPSIKPFAKSFRNTPGQQSIDPTNEASMWRRDRPSLFDKVKNYAGSLTNFVQSDATSLMRGKVCIASLCFYPQERNFFNNKFGKGIPADLMTMMVTEFGKQRIDAIQDFTSYWEDLLQEMDFVQQQEGKEFTIDNNKVQYRIARTYEDIDLAIRSEQLGESLLLFVPTIEGLHIFDQVMDSNVAWDTYPAGVSDEVWPLLIDRAKQLRAGSDKILRPAFVTFAHHFWNGLCGHEKSLGSIVQCGVNQDNGLEAGFTDAGRAVMHCLLDEKKDEHGGFIKPVPIDIKHMNRKSRLEFFHMLDNEFKQVNVPVICSHGGVNGLSDSTNRLRNTPAAQEGLYMEDPINIYDDEIIRIEMSGGLFGIQLDERRIGSKTALRAARGNLARREILYNWSKLVWNQIRHMAEVLDMAGRYAWGIQCLGTDFDGIIDPINGYWTAETMDDLDDYLLKHAYNYLHDAKAPCPLTQQRNRSVKAEEVVDRFMTGNALNLLSRSF